MVYVCVKQIYLALFNLALFFLYIYAHYYMIFNKLFFKYIRSFIKYIRSFINHIRSFLHFIEHYFIIKVFPYILISIWHNKYIFKYNEDIPRKDLYLNVSLFFGEHTCDEDLDWHSKLGKDKFIKDLFAAIDLESNTVYNLIITLNCDIPWENKCIVVEDAIFKYDGLLSKISLLLFIKAEINSLSNVFGLPVRRGCIQEYKEKGDVLCIKFLGTKDYTGTIPSDNILISSRRGLYV